MRPFRGSGKHWRVIMRDPLRDPVDGYPWWIVQRRKWDHWENIAIEPSQAGAMTQAHRLARLHCG